MRVVSWMVRGVLGVAVAVIIVGCSSNRMSDQRLARYRPESMKRNPQEWARRMPVRDPGTESATGKTNVVNRVAAAAHFDGAGDVLRRGDGIIVYLKNIPRPEDIREEVDEVGSITLPLIGKILVSGMSTSQAEDAIKKAYIDGGFYRKIDVIMVADAGSYYVRGEVKRPGSFAISGDVTLVQAITTAGGYTDFARRSRVKVIRGQRDMEFDTDRIEDGEVADPLIMANDTIIVPRRLW